MRVSSANPTVNVFHSPLRASLNNESLDLLNRMKKIHSSFLYVEDRTLSKKIKATNPADLSNVLNCFLEEMIAEDATKDPLKCLDRLSRLIPLAKMQEMVKDDIPDVLAQAKGMFEEAKIYLEKNAKEASPSLRAHLSSVLDSIIAVIESVVNAFGIADFFKSDGESGDMKSQKIMLLLGLFTMLTSLLLPLTGASVGVFIIGGILLTISALSLLWPYIKPVTSSLPINSENWTQEARKKPEAAQGRKESLDEIANIIKMNRHALLIGPSRVGKSLTAKAFAEAIEKGDYPELKGKVVFRINTTDLIAQQGNLFGGSKSILSKISESMGRHRKDIILVLDEIHMACKNDEKIGEQLKTLLDEGGEFSHVIGITTYGEYDAYVRDNHAFSLRFDNVIIKSTNRHETLRILGDTVLKHHSKPILEDDVLDAIYEKSREAKNAPQPTASLNILKKCINRTQRSQKSKTEKKIIKVSNRILSLRSQAAANRGRKNGNSVDIVVLEKELKDLQVKLQKEKIQQDKLFKAKDLLDKVTKKTYQSVLKIGNVAHKKLNANSEKELKKFLLYHEFFNQALFTHITKTSQNLGVSTVIDAKLVNDVTKK